MVCAGSGTIAYARDPLGTIRRVGGLGPILADEGSGYADAAANGIGQLAISLARHFEDDSSIDGKPVCVVLAAVFWRNPFRT